MTKHLRGVFALILLFSGASCVAQFPAKPVPERPSLSNDQTPDRGRKQYLYVSNGIQPHTVSVFPLGGLHFERQMKHNGGGAMAFGPTGNLYVSNGFFDAGQISVYLAGSTKLLFQIENLLDPLAIAVDSGGYLYVANNTSAVSVYAGPQYINGIRDGVGGAFAVAFDRSGNLFVANDSRGTVTIYAPTDEPGHPKLIHTILGLHYPLAFAFGPKGNIYVANKSSVHIFAAKDYTPIKTITGITSVSAIAVDSVDRLYVSSVPFTSSGYRPGWISVYLPGRTRPTRKITDGIDVARSIAVDAQNNVYVANSWNSTVTVYDPGGSRKIRTITDGIAGPWALAIQNE